MCAQTGLTSLSIAQRLGYISLVELLKNITEVAMSPLTMEEKYKVLAPETMQEAALSDSDEEGGRPLSAAEGGHMFCLCFLFIYFRFMISGGQIISTSTGPIFTKFAGLPEL